MGGLQDARDLQVPHLQEPHPGGAALSGGPPFSPLGRVAKTARTASRVMIRTAHRFRHRDGVGISGGTFLTPSLGGSFYAMAPMRFSPFVREGADMAVLPLLGAHVLLLCQQGHDACMPPAHHPVRRLVESDGEARWRGTGERGVNLAVVIFVAPRSAPLPTT